MKAILALLLVAIATRLTFCDDAGPSTNASGDLVISREGKPFYVKVGADGEADMEAAIAKAKGEVSTFIEALLAPTPSQTYFSVKKPFPYNEGESVAYEHIWLSDVTYKDGIFTGLVGNEPMDTDVKLGDEVTVAKEDVSDWMIIDGGKLVGGYTIRVLHDRMNADEQAQLDA